MTTPIYINITICPLEQVTELYAQKRNALTVAKHFYICVKQNMQKRACIFIGMIKMHTLFYALLFEVFGKTYFSINIDFSQTPICNFTLYFIQKSKSEILGYPQYGEPCFI